jgi:hypothetical protein
MPLIAIVAIFAIVLTLTASDSKKPKTELPASPKPGEDPADLMAQALAAYIKDKKKPQL